MAARCQCADWLYCGQRAVPGRRHCQLHSVLDTTSRLPAPAACSLRVCQLAATRGRGSLCVWHRRMALTGSGPAAPSAALDSEYVSGGGDLRRLAHTVFDRLTACLPESGGGKPSSRPRPASERHRLDDSYAMEHVTSVQQHADDSLCGRDVLSELEVVGGAIRALSRLRAAHIDRLHELRQRLKSHKRRRLGQCGESGESGAGGRRGDGEWRGRVLGDLVAQSGESGVHRLLKFRRHCARLSVDCHEGSTCSAVDQEGGGNCQQRALPLAKYCSRHILKQYDQVLYVPCGGGGAVGGGGDGDLKWKCSTAVLPTHGDRCDSHWTPDALSSTAFLNSAQPTRQQPTITGDGQ